MKNNTSTAVKSNINPELAALRGALKDSPPDLSEILPPYGVTTMHWRITESPPPGRPLLLIAAHEPFLDALNGNSPRHKAVMKEFEKPDSLIVCSPETLDEIAARCGLVNKNAISILARLAQEGEALVVVADGTLRKMLSDAEALTTAIEHAAKDFGDRVTVLTRIGKLSGVTPTEPSLTRSNDFVTRGGSSEGIELPPDSPKPPKFPAPVFQHDTPSRRR